MVKFCKYCNNILNINYTKEDTIIFLCDSCAVFHDAVAEDTLIYRKDYKNRFENHYGDILEHSKYDDIIYKINKKCIKCPNNIVKRVYVGEDMKLFNICTKCNEIWLN